MAFIEAARHSGKAWAVCRLPGDSVIHLFNGQALSEGSLSEGFLLQPFDPQQRASLIPFWGTTTWVPPFTTVPPKTWSCTEDYDPAYEQLVEKALHRIEEGVFVKAVPARQKLWSLTSPLPLGSLYSMLYHAYPKAAVIWAFTPEHGEWMGASPEPLLEYSGHEAQTVALAGTINPEDPKAAFSPKEHEEQERVAEFIHHTAHEMGLYVQESPVARVRYGPVAHLRSTFRITFPDTLEVGTQALALARKLHPTPAVCGLPRHAALQFLKTYEGQERGLYAGFWGLAREDRLALFVNLRCMYVAADHQQVSLFAGAGVVRGSVPSAELQETKRKMATLGRFLNAFT